MNYILLAIVIGVALAKPNQQDAAGLGNITRDRMKVIMAADPKDMIMCQSDADCASHAGKTKCGQVFHLCRPADWPKFELVEGSCSDDSGCKPMRRCLNGQCHFSGPKSCNSNSDCLQGVQGMQYECTELAKTAPGKRCYPKCSADDVCHNRITAEEFKSKVGCCGGYCQKKSAC